MYQFFGHGWGMGFGWIIGILILVIVIWIVVKALNQNTSNNRQSDKSPLDILKERYARGEIDKQEFDQRKKDLME
ncbi:MAG: SHOCT domain-containing protein [Candidatus Cloacimonetes bacterium]|nr:SHOCT domain-containing protein [Candidatus Cloacimonadota bacterium]